MPVPPVLGSADLGRLLAAHPFTALDVGARGGFSRDLLPLAPAVDARGFEPDADECRRLDEAAASAPGPWRSLRFLPAALAAAAGSRTLHLTHQPGASSLLPPLPGRADRFARGSAFAVERTAPVETLSLDEAAHRFALREVRHLKIDVEGLELEVFEGARSVLDELVAIRTEVAFQPLRQGQPLFADVEAFLRARGFQLICFPEVHSWRRATRAKHPALAVGPVPWSRGQLVHADAFFLREPEDLDVSSDAGARRAVQAAFLALVYGHVDHARAYLGLPAVERFVRDGCGLDRPAVERGLATASMALYRRSLQSEGRALLRAGRRAWASLVR